MHFNTIMKNTHSFTQITSQIQSLAPQMGGVFTFSDLWNLIGLNSADRTAKVISRLIRDKIMIKVRRGLYATKSPDLWILASRFKEQAIISMDSVLARNGLIGATPNFSVSLIYPGPNQTIETPFGRLRFFKIKKQLLFGGVTIKGGVTVSDSEKAFIDLLYYHVKGGRFIADPKNDIDLWKLDKEKIKTYLKKYQNPKFIKFVMGLINE